MEAVGAIRSAPTTAADSGIRARLDGFGDAALVAAPSDVGARVGEHDRVGLQTSHEREDARPIVPLTFSVRSFPVRAVEPDLGDLPVTREQLRELAVHEIDIAAPVAAVGAAGVLARPAARPVVGMMPVEL